MSITREEIRQLCIAHDRFMAEQASEPIAAAPVRKNDPGDDLVYKVIEDALQDNPQPDAAPSDDEPTLGDAVVAFAAATDRRFERLEHAHAELRGQVSALLTLLGQKSGNFPTAGKLESGDVIDLPARKPPHVA